MRELINIIEGRDWNHIRDGKHVASSSAFQAWFSGSKCVTSDGHPMMMFHASMSNDIEEFLPEKIREVDYDAPFNGFWFSSDPETQPAWCSLDKLICIPVFLSIKNPAPWRVWRKVVADVNQELSEHYRESGMNPIRQGARTTHDEVRYRLQDLGYDGIVWEHPPQIDRDAFARDGKYEYRDSRGHKHWIERGQHHEQELRDVEGEGTRVYVWLNDEAMDEAMPYPNAVLQMILDKLGWSKKIEFKPDWSKYDMDKMSGEVTFGDDVVHVRSIKEKVKHRAMVPTGKILPTVELYSDSIGHITGYDDLDDFIDSQKHQVWVAFSPTQIKSAYNKGTWNPSNPKIVESVEGSYTLYHGSPSPDIREFRTKELRNRTGTPGTLSFTQSEKTAEIYGSYIYKVLVQGYFGDYLDPNDVKQVFEYRKSEARRNGYYQKVFGEDQAKWDGLFERMLREIETGYYAKWENKTMWNALGWQGAWCFESDSRNLIIGDASCVKKIIGVVNSALISKVSDFIEEIKSKHDLFKFDLTLSGKTLRLNMLAVFPNVRSKGIGSTVMEELCDFADLNDLKIVLTPNDRDSHLGTTSYARLVKFYKRFGFYENSGRAQDFSINDKMIRDPR